MTFFVYCRDGTRIGSIEIIAQTPEQAQLAADSYAAHFKAGATARLLNTTTRATACEQCGCPSADAVCRRCRLGRQED